MYPLTQSCLETQILFWFLQLTVKPLFTSNGSWLNWSGELGNLEESGPLANWSGNSEICSVSTTNGVRITDPDPGFRNGLFFSTFTESGRVGLADGVFGEWEFWRKSTYRYLHILLRKVAFFKERNKNLLFQRMQLQKLGGRRDSDCFVDLSLAC